jgi:hypothetical protein
MEFRVLAELLIDAAGRGDESRRGSNKMDIGR